MATRVRRVAMLGRRRRAPSERRAGALVLEARGLLLLQSSEVLLAELGDLGGDDHHAVGLEAVVLEVLLVVVLGRVESG